MTIRTKTMTATVVAAGLLALAACSRSEPQQPLNDSELGLDEPVANATTDAPPLDAPSASPIPAPDTNAVAVEAPPEAPIKPDAQVLDDADATGMTARVTRDDPAHDAVPANDQAPQ